MSYITTLKHDTDPRKLLQDQIGDLSSIELFNNQVLVAVYQRPERTQGGIILTDHTRGEDQYQSKVGLVLKRGPAAFDANPEDDWFKDQVVNDGDWIVYRASDGWPITIRKTLCRILLDTTVRMRIQNPDEVW
jgi:co-chaperonin GroES (HSP10)